MKTKEKTKTFPFSLQTGFFRSELYHLVFGETALLLVPASQEGPAFSAGYEEALQVRFSCEDRSELEITLAEGTLRGYFSHREPCRPLVKELKRIFREKFRVL